MAALALAQPAGADEPSARDAFETELRAAVLANGDVIAKALAGPTQMQQHIQNDLSLLEQLAPDLLAGHPIALFTAKDCETCAPAVHELTAITNRYGTTFIQHDLSHPQPARWAAALGLTDAPFYVLPEMILNGHMPPIVLEKHLTPNKVKSNPQPPD
ncbi:disulfide bond formation protein DsbA [Sulfitobacter sp. 1A13496]|uniref:disulfide bond formation protein DsbA n=1 Tax=Sulfitobacter sp. 1A13496 TaxID=3368596 RepID=UPI0037458AA2